MLEFCSVTKRFSQSPKLVGLLPSPRRQYITALEKVSFRCERGETIGIVGPNGAGKTTLAKMVVNLVLPDSGDILINGERLTTSRHDLRKKVVLITSDDRSFFGRLSGLENLRFFLGLYGIRETHFALLLAERLGMAKYLNRSFAQYSTGMRKRLALIRGLMANPDILLFDEATNGLDPASTGQLKCVLKEWFADKTILWTTHRMEEVKQICQRVLALTDGHVLFDSLLSDSGQGQAGESSSRSVALEEVCLSLFGN
jgi:ABC-type multidrug transport system ATPase subunit